MDDDDDWLTRQFEDNRGHLRAVAYRMLGSMSEADDAVQEASIRLGRTDTREVENIGGWLTTVVSRVCLDMLRSRSSRREDPFGVQLPDPIAGAADLDTEHEALLADSMGPALLVILDTLAPAERLAFVLHDLFAVPFDEIATIVDRSPAAARQLASRARRRVQGADPAGEPDLRRQRAIVDAFLAASRDGRFDELLAMLDPDVVMRADAAAVASGSDAETTGRDAVAATFSGRAKGATTAVIDGFAGLVWAQGGTPRAVFDFTIDEGRIVEISLVMDPEQITALDVEILG